MSWIFDSPTEPIDVAVVLDASKTVEADIPVEGGAITARGADGTVYTLDIPGDALLSETTIGLTPVTSIAGMPFGGEQTYAVQLSPEGLFLYNIAALTITPAEPIPVGEQLVFGYQEDGKGLIFAPPVVDSSEIKVQVLHFSGNGVTRGLLADIEPERRRLGGDTERRFSDAISTELIRIRQEGGEWSGAEIAATFESALLEYERQVVNPRVAAAGESCEAGRLAIESVLGLERLRQLTAGSDGGSAFEKYPGVATRAARVCVLEEFELCVQDHVIHRMAGVWRGYERQAALGMPIDDAVLREARELTIKCLTFRLDFESTGTLTVAGGGGYTSTVSSEVVLRFSPDDDKITGEAPLVNEAFEFFWPCGATSIRGGGTFRAFNLKILTARPDAASPDVTGQEVGFLLGYLPGITSESATTRACGLLGAANLPNLVAWTTTFVATHTAEVDAQSEWGGGYVSIDWEVFGAEYFAKKEWIKEAGGVVEAGTFKLYHTPGG